MDIATILGIVLGLLSIFMSIGSNIIIFYNLPSVFTVLGGGIASVLISYRLSEVTSILKVVAKAFSGKQASNTDTISMLVELSQKARREGLLALESDQDNIEDDFIKQSLQLIVDGVEPDMIRESMSLELETLEARHEKGQGLFKTMAAIFPAWGMIGTLMGLVQLLKALDDVSMIGPSMALALLTTFYGAVLAYFICTPVANKLAIKSKEELHNKQMIIEGILSIQAGENPRLMEHKLKTFLSPSEKYAYEHKDENAQASTESKEAGV